MIRRLLSVSALSRQRAGRRTWREPSTAPDICAHGRTRFWRCLSPVWGAEIGRWYAPRARQLPYTAESCARSSTDRASDYGSEGWGFESLRARPAQRPVANPAAGFLAVLGATLG